MAKLTKLQEALYAEIQRVTTKLKGTPDLIYSRIGNVFYRRRGSRYSAGTFRGLVKAGLIVHEGEEKYALSGNAELVDIAALNSEPDAGDGAAKWTAAELAAYSEDNPYPPHKPGATADDTLASYEYEIAALKQERDRLRAALDKIHRLMFPANEPIVTGGDGYLMRVWHIIDEALAVGPAQEK